MIGDVVNVFGVEECFFWNLVLLWVIVIFFIVGFGVFMGMELLVVYIGFVMGIWLGSVNLVLCFLV